MYSSENILMSLCLLRSYFAGYTILGSQIFLNCLLEMLLYHFLASIFAVVNLLLNTLAFLWKWAIISHGLLQLTLPFLCYFVYSFTKICLRKNFWFLVFSSFPSFSFFVLWHTIVLSVLVSLYFLIISRKFSAIHLINYCHSSPLSWTPVQISVWLSLWVSSLNFSFIISLLFITFWIISLHIPANPLGFSWALRWMFNALSLEFYKFVFCATSFQIFSVRVILYSVSDNQLCYLLVTLSYSGFFSCVFRIFYSDLPVVEINLWKSRDKNCGCFLPGAFSSVWNQSITQAGPLWPTFRISSLF